MRAPCLAQIGRVAHFISRLFVVYDDHDASGVAKLVLVGVVADHAPGDAGVVAQERVALLVREEIVADRAYAHDEAGSGGREHATVVVR